VSVGTEHLDRSTSSGLVRAAATALDFLIQVCFLYRYLDVSYLRRTKRYLEG
jgi:hypothetical protein